MRGPYQLACLGVLATMTACGGVDAKRKPVTAGGVGNEGAEDTAAPSMPVTPAAPVAAGAPVTAGATAAGPASAGAMPPATPKKAGCLDSSRGAMHTFVGKLEKHPDGSGNFRVHLAKKVCFSGGRFSSGETDDVVLDIEEAKATPLLARKVKVVGKSQDFAPAKKFAYVMRLEVVSLAATK